MTNELGRELTTAEHIAVATGQTTIMDIVHGEALNMDIEWNAQIHCVMPSGVVLTWGDLWYEMHRPQPQPFANTQAMRLPRSVTEQV